MTDNCCAKCMFRVLNVTFCHFSFEFSLNFKIFFLFSLILAFYYIYFFNLNLIYRVPIQYFFPAILVLTVNSQNH